MKNVVQLNSEINTPAALKKAILAKTFGGYCIRDILQIYADCHETEGYSERCLNANVTADSVGLIKGAEMAIPDGYNNFDSSRLVAILFALVAGRDGVVSDDALRSLDRDYTFRFGREGSPVLYIRSLNRTWMETLSAIQKVSKADEMSLESSNEIRIWWD